MIFKWLGFGKKHQLFRWARGQGYMHEVYGESHFQEHLEYVAGGRLQYGVKKKCIAILVPEPNNHYDKNAVRVDIKGKPVGYLPNSKAKEYHEKLNEAGAAGQPVEVYAKIVGGWAETEYKEQGSFGVKLSISSKWTIENS
jgi:hypothetical protein